MSQDGRLIAFFAFVGRAFRHHRRLAPGHAIMDVAEDILDELLGLPVVWGDLDLVSHQLLVPLIDLVEHVDRAVQGVLRPEELLDVFGGVR